VVHNTRKLATAAVGILRTGQSRQQANKIRMRYEIRAIIDV